jgi:hypothetical protein
MDLALFPMLQSDIYWSGTKFDSIFAWDFHFSEGNQGANGKGSSTFFTWAVHSGNVGASTGCGVAVWIRLDGVNRGN